MPMTAMAMATQGGHLLYGLIGLVVWLLVLVWIYNIAKRKGRHAFGWLILGFFFSVITLVVILLVPSKLTTERYRR